MATVNHDARITIPNWRQTVLADFKGNYTQPLCTYSSPWWPGSSPDLEDDGETLVFWLERGKDFAIGWRKQSVSEASTKRGLVPLVPGTWNEQEDRYTSDEAREHFSVGHGLMPDHGVIRYSQLDGGWIVTNVSPADKTGWLLCVSHDAPDAAPMSMTNGHYIGLNTSNKVIWWGLQRMTVGPGGRTPPGGFRPIKMLFKSFI